MINSIFFFQTVSFSFFFLIPTDFSTLSPTSLGLLPHSSLSILSPLLLLFDTAARWEMAGVGGTGEGVGAMRELSSSSGGEANARGTGVTSTGSDGT